MSSPLNDCGCCEGVTAETPVNVTNRPGLTAIAYRIGTHEQFKESMLAALSDSTRPELNALTTRAEDDFSIALLDAFATMADVITFYQERIANESYLRTAIERRSLLELSRLIGYELRPGVAASTYLAFTLENAPSAPIQTTIDIGSKVQSIPGPNEKPQTFETVERIEARAEWTAVTPRLVQPQLITSSMGSVIAKGAATNLNPGDMLLIVDVGGPTLRTIVNVPPPDNKSKTTRIDFDNPSLSPSHLMRLAWWKGSVADFPNKIELDDGVVQKIINHSWSEADLSSLAEKQNWDLDKLAAGINERTKTHTSAPLTEGVFAFRRHAAIFGYNAPIWDSLPASSRVGSGAAQYKSDGSFDKMVFVPAAYPAPGWENRTLEEDSEASGNQRLVYLDSTYPGIAKDSWIALVSPTVQPQAFKVDGDLEITRSDYAISGKVSQLKVEAGSPFDLNFKIRNTTVLAQSEQLELAEVPIVDEVQGDTPITLDGAYLGLKTGQKVILSGERSDLTGVTNSEMMTLKDIILEAGFTVLTFDKPLTYSYIRNTVTINANVALATHGETVHEVLGSGDAAQPYQKFKLQQSPLTYVSTENASGAESTLRLRVNDLLWHEQSTLYGHGPREHIFITRIDDNHKVTTESGDGVTGARLPSGQNNAQATYRKGIGLEGLVKAGQLSVLLTRPLGVKGVVNPEDATGAADPQSLDDARVNGPLTVLTLDRAVSLKDYEDFARAFAGIAKALATWTWDGQTRRVFLTVAGPDGAEIEPDSNTHNNLLAALRKSGDPFVDLRVTSYRPAYFKLSGNVTVDPDFLPEKVQADVEQTLHTQFSFDARAFGQPVMLSEVIAAIQAVSGVVAVDLVQLYRSDESPDLNYRLLAAMPQITDGDPDSAELLTLDPASMDQLVMVR